MGIGEGTVGNATAILYKMRIAAKLRNRIPPVDLLSTILNAVYIPKSYPSRTSRRALFSTLFVFPNRFGIVSADGRRIGSPEVDEQPACVSIRS